MIIIKIVQFLNSACFEREITFLIFKFLKHCPIIGAFPLKEKLYNLNLNQTASSVFENASFGCCPSFQNASCSDQQRCQSTPNYHTNGCLSFLICPRFGVHVKIGRNAKVSSNHLTDKESTQK